MKKKNIALIAGVVIAGLILVPFGCSKPRADKPELKNAASDLSGYEKALPGPFPGTKLAGGGQIWTVEVAVLDLFSSTSLEATANLGGGKTLSVFCKEGKFPPGLKGGDRFIIRGRVIEDRSVGDNTNLVMKDVTVVKSLGVNPR